MGALGRGGRMTHRPGWGGGGAKLSGQGDRRSVPPFSITVTGTTLGAHQSRDGVDTRPHRRRLPLFVKVSRRVCSVPAGWTLLQPPWCPTVTDPSGQVRRRRARPPCPPRAVGSERPRGGGGEGGGQLQQGAKGRGCGDSRHLAKVQRGHAWGGEDTPVTASIDSDRSDRKGRGGEGGDAGGPTAGPRVRGAPQQRDHGRPSGAVGSVFDPLDRAGRHRAHPPCPSRAVRVASGAAQGAEGEGRWGATAA